MRLYELTEAYLNIVDLDLETSDLDLALHSLEGTLTEKTEGVLKVIKTLEAEQDAYTKEIARLTDLKKKATKKVDDIKDYLSYNLQVMQVDKVETPLFKVSFRKSEVLVVDDLETIPEEYITIKTSKVADKKAIKQLLKDGTAVEGCHIQVNQNLQIK